MSHLKPTAILSEEELQRRKTEYKLWQEERNRQDLKLVEQAQTGDLSARNHLVKTYRRLIVKITRKYIRQEIGFNDLFNEAHVAVLEAIDKFDLWHKEEANPESTFRGYVARAIKTQFRHMLRHHKNKHGCPVSLPYPQVTELSKLGKATKALTRQQGQFPDSDETREYLGHSPRKWETLMKACRLIRLAPLKQAARWGLYHKELGDQSLKPDDLVIKKDELERVLSHLYELSDPELLVIYRSFGLDDYDPQTNEEIGLMLGMSYEGARKMKLRVLKRLRESVQS